MKSNEEQKLIIFLEQWQNGTLPSHHLEEFLALLERPDLEYLLAKETEKVWEETEKVAVFDGEQKETMLAAIFAYRQVKHSWIKYTAAAATVGLILTLGVLWQPAKEKETFAKTTSNSSNKAVDIAAPATNKAFLRLGDGREIILEDFHAGTLATEGTINVVKQDSNHLVYSGTATTGKWNTLTVPKGSKPFRITLSDGSHVTVNVASSLTYPTAFSGKSRNVKMTGEAYFEITKSTSPSGSSKMPFVVEANGMSVEVKGTKFNVNAYEDERVTKTTLVEGTVNILAGNVRRTMAPGQQATVNSDSAKGIKLDNEADIDEATAWVNDKFRFQDADLETVMRQVARWYDVEVKFSAKPQLRFGGQIDRYCSLRQMLAILETSGVHFSISGKVVTILP